MNVFVLHTDPVLSAAMLCDKHIVKMQLESAQLLSSAYYIRTGRAHLDLYMPTHLHHPCTVHIAKSTLYRDWICINARAMAVEHMKRYGGTRKHVSWQVTLQAYTLLKALDSCFEETLVVPLAMPESIRGELKSAPIEQAVGLYREYYIKHKSSIAQWKYCEAPSWWPQD